MPIYSTALWRQLAVIAAVVLTIASWVATTRAEFTCVESTFQHLLSAAVFGVVLVAAALLFAADCGLVPARHFALALAAIAANIAVHQLIVLVGLPFYADSLGTLFAAVVGGPVLGMFVGVLSTVVTSLVSPVDLAFAPVGLFIGFAAGTLVRMSAFDRIGRTIIAGLGVGVVSGMLSVYPTLLSLDGVPSSASAGLIEFYSFLFRSELPAVIGQSLTSDPLDKAFSLLAVCAFIRFSGPRLRGWFLYPGNVRYLNKIWRSDATEGNVLDLCAEYFTGSRSIAQDFRRPR